ncbi:MAG: hypothetical protein AAF371_09510 [Pseudomonadota bacterium]
MTMRCAAILTASLLLPSVASSGAAMADEAAPGPREEMRERTQALGLSVGNTYACHDDADMRDAIEEEAHLIFDLILKETGSDMAWAFATGAGYGASLPAAEMDCAALANSWQEIRADFGIAEDE